MACYGLFNILHFVETYNLVQMIRLISCDFKQELWHQIHRKKPFYTDKNKKIQGQTTKNPSDICSFATNGS